MFDIVVGKKRPFSNPWVVQYSAGSWTRWSLKVSSNWIFNLASVHLPKMKHFEMGRCSLLCLSETSWCLFTVTVESLLILCFIVGHSPWSGQRLLLLDEQTCFWNPWKNRSSVNGTELQKSLCHIVKRWDNENATHWSMENSGNAFNY